MIRRILLTLITAAIFTSCGSVTTLQTRNGKPVQGVSASYKRVIVKDFTHTLKDDDGTTPIAARRFADKITDSIRISKPGADVTRNGKTMPGTLAISGEVTRYTEGNAALRLLVGMGAGSSYFDANVYLTDAATGQEIGMIKIDKNSWALGGGLAATQTVESYMTAGAKTTANEVIKFLK